MWHVMHVAKNLPEAHIVCHTLIAGGCDARVRGEQRPSIAGEIPLVDAGVEVVVPEAQVLLARTLLTEVERERPSWTCERCGEENPGAFDVCWKCAGG